MCLSASLSMVLSNGAGGISEGVIIDYRLQILPSFAVPKPSFAIPKPLRNGDGLPATDGEGQQSAIHNLYSFRTIVFLFLFISR